MQVPIELTDAQISALLAEPKPLPRDYKRLLNLRAKNAHHGSQLAITASSGRLIELFLRQAINPIDFSAIFGYHSPATGRIFRLRRYNGKSHRHGNRIEGDTFYDFHIHMATERYQALGSREDTYAQPSARFYNLTTALDCLIEDCGFGVPTQANLFSSD